MHYLGILIATIIVYFIYVSIRSKVANAFTLEGTDIGTNLNEFRESHAVSNLIKGGPLNLNESVVQQYERMCIKDPVKYQNDPSIPKLLIDYKDIISGRVLDPQGHNVPSEYILGSRNPDYSSYFANQADALRNLGSSELVNIISSERSRVVRVEEENTARSIFLAQLVEEGIPALIASAAITDEKLNTYNASDWKKFCKIIKGHLSVSDRNAVQNFVRLFDEKEIIFNTEKFESFAIFHKYNVSEVILTEIMRDRVTLEQAIRMVKLVQDYGYEWKEAMVEILNDDASTEKATSLRSSYGYKR